MACCLKACFHVSFLRNSNFCLEMNSWARLRVQSWEWKIHLFDAMDGSKAHRTIHPVYWDPEHQISTSCELGISEQLLRNSPAHATLWLPWDVTLAYLSHLEENGYLSLTHLQATGLRDTTENMTVQTSLLMRKKGEKETSCESQLYGT
jgi:hypothetical protein